MSTLALLGAHPSQTDIVGDPCEPGRKPLRIAQRVQVTPRFEERFLGEIFGDLGISGDPGAYTNQPISLGKPSLISR